METFKQHLIEIRKAKLSGRYLDAVINEMKSLGFRLLGEGLFGAVFEHELRKYAVKVFFKADKNYIKWVNFCKKNQDNPYLPKFIGNITPLNKEMNLIRMEKLEFARYNKAIKFIEKHFIGDPHELKNKNPKGDPHLKQIFKELKVHEKYLDLSTDNVMRRGKQWVVTDPLYTPSAIG